MPYIRNGQVVAQRSVFRPSIIMEVFWKFMNIIGLFFGTMSAVRVSSSWSTKRSDKHRSAGGCEARLQDNLIRPPLAIGLNGQRSGRGDFYSAVPPPFWLLV
ncbi:unnamed protein product [Ectocarpus sp. 4 AP-2014]